MKNTRILLSILLIITLSIASYSKEEKSQKIEKDFSMTSYMRNGEIKDFLNLKTITFQDQKYELYYSTAVSVGGQKSILQEYVPMGQTVFDFDQMITVQLFYTMSDEESSEGYAYGKLESLNARSKVLPYTRGAIGYVEEEQEYIVEFVASSGFDSDSKDKVLEWGVYRYYDFKNSKNEKYVMVIEFSKRHYGEQGAKKFANEVGILQKKYMVDFNEMELPKVNFLSKSELTEENLKKYKE